MKLNLCKGISFLFTDKLFGYKLRVVSGRKVKSENFVGQNLSIVENFCAKNLFSLKYYHIFAL